MNKYFDVVIAIHYVCTAHHFGWSVIELNSIRLKWLKFRFDISWCSDFGLIFLMIYSGTGNEFFRFVFQNFFRPIIVSIYFLFSTFLHQSIIIWLLNGWIDAHVVTIILSYCKHWINSVLIFQLSSLMRSLSNRKKCLGRIIHLL